MFTHAAVLHATLWLISCFVTLVAITLLHHRYTYPRSTERIIAFFHPFCSSGGGGERVLWAIIQAIGEINDQGLPVKVLIYTVDKPSASYKKGTIKNNSVLSKHRFAFAFSFLCF